MARAQLRGVCAGLLFLVLSAGAGARILPIPRVHVDQLSVEEFDATYLEKLPIIITGVSTCPANVGFQNLGKYCGGFMDSRMIKVKTNKSEWAGLEGGTDESMPFMDFIDSMGKAPVLRYVFDLQITVNCPSLLSNVHVPAHFTKVFARQWLTRHMREDNHRKCERLPFYNMYLAEAGFQTNLHIDSGHTAFTASMCEGRKRWRVLSHANFRANLDKLPNKPGVPATEVNGTLVHADVLQPFDTWSEASLLDSLESVEVYEGTLSPGETIFIPAGAPHAAETLDKSWMVASNARTMNGEREHRAACKRCLNSVKGKCEGRKCTSDREYEEIERNYAQFGPNEPRAAMTFLESYGCGKPIQQLLGEFDQTQGKRIVDIRPETFEADVAQGGPIVIAKMTSRCTICTRLQVRWPMLGARFAPELRFAQLECSGGCPPAKGAASTHGYREVVRFDGNYPAFVLLTPASYLSGTRVDFKNKTWVLNFTIARYYGPRTLDDILVWASIHSGSKVWGIPLWWDTAFRIFHYANLLLGYGLQAFGLPVTGDGPGFRSTRFIPDGGTLAVSAIVVGVVLVVTIALACVCCRWWRLRAQKKQNAKGS